MPAPKYYGDLIIIFRPAVTRDVDAILELEEISFAHVEEKFGRRQIQNLIANPRAKVVAAESNDRVLGWAAGLIRHHQESISGRLYAVAVHPDARGRGIGQKLVCHILHSLTKMGAKRIFLEVNVENRAAIKLYHKLGFADWRYLSDYYGPGYHALRMVREIATP